MSSNLNICNQERQTTVSNVKVKYIRPKYRNLEEWVADTNNVYIGRAGVVFVDGVRFPKATSLWANPFKIGKDGDRDDVIRKFEEYIVKKIADETLNEELLKLKNKNLGCWCVSGTCTDCNGVLVCHGQVLKRLIESIEL